MQKSNTLHAKLYIFQTILSGLFKAESLVYLWIYALTSVVFVRTTHSKVGQQLLGLTLRVNPWLWNWALVPISQTHLSRLGEFTHWESLNMALWFAWILEYSFGGKFTICAWI